MSVSSIRVGDVDVVPYTRQKNLGSWFDPHMDMATHIRKYLTRECAEKLIHAFITSWLDYCNSLLYEVSDRHMLKLQRVMNASA